MGRLRVRQITNPNKSMRGDKGRWKAVENATKRLRGVSFLEMQNLRKSPDAQKRLRELKVVVVGLLSHVQEDYSI